MPAGRPSEFNQSIANTICTRLIHGESLRSICRDDDMPDVSTVYYWIHDYPEFSKQYDKAKMEQIDTFADEIIEIADDSTNDFYEKKLKSGDVSVVGDMELVNRAKLRVETRKWVAERMKPKKYGVRQEIEHSGKIDSAMQIVLVTPTERLDSKVKEVKL